MSLRVKILLLALLTAVALITTMYFGTSAVLLGGFGQIEQNYVTGRVKLVERTLEAEREALEAHVLAWSAWNDMYRFAVTPNKAFAQSELGASALSAMDIDFFIITRPSGEIIFNQLLGSLAGKSQLPNDIRKYISHNASMVQYTSVRDVRTELTSLRGVPALVASAPIVTSEYQGPIRGSLIVGRFLIPRRLGELRNTTGLDFALYPLDRPLPETALPAWRQLQSAPPKASVVEHLQKVDSIQGYIKLQDRDRRDVLLLGVTTSRPIYAQALRSRVALLAVVIGISALFVILTIYLLHRAILSRLAALSRGVKAITQEQSFAKRLDLHGKDEFAGLAADTNEMLQVLESTQREASENQARYALVSQGINDGIWDRDLTTNETYYSARWRSMLGYPGEAALTSVDIMQSHLHPDDRVRVKENIVAHLKGETQFFESEARMRLLDGSYRWMLLRGAAERDTTGWAVRLAGSLTDLTRRGLFDPLTGLPNRLLLHEKLAYTLGKSKEEPGRRSALLFMDLNRFKLVNDSLGHHVGDLLLVEVAKRLQGSIRPCDTVARLGGDEFVIVLDDLGGEKDLERAVQRISGTTTTSLTLSGHRLNIGMSIGVIADLSAYATIDDALRDADNAMYHAKATRAPFAYFDQRMLAKAQERLQLEADLRHAVEHGELSLVFQPVILFRDTRMSGVEALVRWHHPTLGTIPPSEFIPIAEETGLIDVLGEWVLREACREVNRLGGSLTLGVNLSSKQFDEGLVERIAALLDETGFSPQRLVLEVTESAVIGDPLLAASVLARLRALGVSIALDDFGTGYSSLSYLSSLPLDILKIDRTFVARLMADVQSVAIVRTIIALAQTLNLSVVAEGVETAEQAKLLKSLGCPYAQGYYFATPVAIESLTGLARRTFDPDAAVEHTGPVN